MFFHNKVTGSACAGMTNFCIVLDFCDQGRLQRDQPDVRNPAYRKPDPVELKPELFQPKPEVRPDASIEFRKVPTEDESDMVSLLTL